MHTTWRRQAYWLLAVTALLALAGATVAMTASMPAAARDGNGIDPADFVRTVDNAFFPLTPGTTFSYEGTKDGVPTTDVTQVTHRTKRILGVTTTVVLDRAYEDGVLAEDTIDWYAQDDEGNVWYFGEDTKELDEDGNVISTEGTWRAGVNGALPGIIMEAHPRRGDRYNQEVAPGVAEDKAQVLSLNQSACVRYGCFDELLQIKEWTPLDPGVVEDKYFAEGIGFVLGVMVRGGNERTELVSITTE